MKHNKAKVPENLVLVPQLDDISNIHTRLIQLSGKLKGLPTWELSPDDRSAIGRAMGLIDAALMLEAINFDLMKAVIDELDDATVEPCHTEVRGLYSLAVDIWIDIPIGMIPNPDNDECTAWGCCGKSVEAENRFVEQMNVYQCPSQCPECEAPEIAIYNTPDEFSSTGHSWQCAVCNSILSPAPTLPKLKEWGEE